MRFKQRLLGGAALALIGATAAYAAPAPKPADPTALDEVVVTGTLRSQKLQDAPLAVTSISGSDFLNSGFKEPRELQFLSPSIQVSQQGGNGLFIRGDGTASQNGGTEQSVGMVIDGVLMGFVDDIGGDVSDLDHIEVYRGPQGTQFAKNASAGVVSITTKNPVIGEFNGSTHLTWGEHEDSNDDLIVNLPVNDTMAARFSLADAHRSGVYYNIPLHSYEDSRKQYAMRGKFLWEPANGAKIVLAADYRHEELKPAFAQAWAFCGPPGPTTTYVNVYGTHNLPPCNGALLAGIVPSLTNSTSAEQDDARRHNTTGGVSLQVDYPLGAFELTSISAYRNMFRFQYGPSGSGEATSSYLSNRYGGGQLSEELRLASPAASRLSYVAGIFLYRRSTGAKVLSAGPFYGQAFGEYPNTPYGANVWIASAGGQVNSHNLSKSMAAFADGTFHVTEKFQISSGVRVTHDDVSANSVTALVAGVYTTTVGGPVKPADGDSVTNTGLTYRLSPQYFFTPNLQVYASAAHGYKGPLIDSSVNVFTTIKPETVNAFEAGIKSSWFEHRLTVNFTAFHEKFKDYQVSTLNTTVVPNVFQLGNAGGQLSQGVELEINARPIHDLVLTAGTTVLDARFTDFVTACYNAGEPIKQAKTTDPAARNACYTKPGTTTTYANAAGTPLLNASKYTVKLGANYNHALGNGYAIDASADYLWRSDFWSAPADPNLVNPSYGIANFNAGISWPGDKYRLGIWVRNAFNTFFTSGSQANNGGRTIVLNPEAVRTIGASFDLKFQ